MDQEKIGKFIFDRRNSLKMTQLELAERIGVTDKAVSKWERGKGMPDYSLFLPLCDALDITVNELLDGRLNSKSEDSIPNYLEFESKRNKKKIIYLSFVLFLICLSLILGIFFINNYKNIYIYEINGKGEYLEYNNGAFVISNIKNVLIPGDVSDHVITPNEKIIISQTFVVGSKNRVLYENYTGNIVSEKYGEEIVFDDEVLDEIMNCDVLLIDDIGAENNSPWARDEVLGTILQHRMNNDLTTFFTSNFTIDELEQVLSETSKGSDIIKARRIIERIRYLTVEDKLISENKRK
jgi:transcriptional regulator with XRE-family HTH domain